MAHTLREAEAGGSVIVLVCSGAEAGMGSYACCSQLLSVSCRWMMPIATLSCCPCCWMPGCWCPVSPPPSTHASSATCWLYRAAGTWNSWLHNSRRPAMRLRLGRCCWLHGTLTGPCGLSMLPWVPGSRGCEEMQAARLRLCDRSAASEAQHRPASSSCALTLIHGHALLAASAFFLFAF